MRPILSLRDLAWRMDTSLERLRAVAGDIKNHYKHCVFWDEKKTKNRNLEIPRDELMDIQRRIKGRILDRYPLPDCVHGGVGGKSPRSNAEQRSEAHHARELDYNHLSTPTNTGRGP